MMRILVALFAVTIMFSNISSIATSIAPPPIGADFSFSFNGPGNLSGGNQAYNTSHNPQKPQPKKCIISEDSRIQASYSYQEKTLELAQGRIDKFLKEMQKIAKNNSAKIDIDSLAANIRMQKQNEPYIYGQPVASPQKEKSRTYYLTGQIAFTVDSAQKATAILSELNKQSFQPRLSIEGRNNCVAGDDDDDDDDDDEPMPALYHPPIPPPPPPLPTR